VTESWLVNEIQGRGEPVLLREDSISQDVLLR
jgi:hypothetical protein